MRRAARLLPIAALVACGRGERADAEKGADERAGTPWLVEEAAVRGLVFEHRSGHSGAFLMPEIMGGGGALFDADGDGDLDVYLVQGGRLVPGSGPGPASHLFENTDGGRFRDVTAASGAAGEGYGMGAATGDVDEDGDPDLYVTRVGPNALFRNLGALAFEDASASSGTAHDGWGTSAGFFDADVDGDLDLFVANYLDWSVEGELPCFNVLSQPDYCSPKNYRTPARDVLYVNEGGGRFRDASEESGVAAKRGTGLGVVFGDLDANGWIDVFVANDGMANHLWRNQDGRRFTEAALLAGCGVDSTGQEKAGMGVVCADLDGDLDLDLLVCNLAGETDSLYVNENGFFVDRTALSGLAPVSRPFTRFGVGVLDLDHDGELDLFEATGRVQSATEPRTADVYAEENLLFRGLGPALFTEIPLRGGTAGPLVATARAALFGDVDDDGAIDVVVVNRDAPAHLLMNRAAKANRSAGGWIRLDVRERSGRAALGAALEIEVEEKRLRRDVASASSYLAASDPRVHLGLGEAPGVASATVRWVDGERESFGPLEAGRTHVLARGAGRAVD